MDKSLFRTTTDGLLIKIKIVPNSSKNEIIKEEEFLKIKVTAQPIENKANKAITEFLSKELKVPKTTIEIVKGAASKEKTILIKTTEAEKQQEIIDNLIKR